MALAVALEVPVFARALRWSRGNPRVEESVLGGVPATTYRPSRGSGPWPAVVVYPGVTRQGRHHPAFVGLGRGLASIGCLAVVTEPAGIARGELTTATVRDALRIAETVVARRDAARDGVVLVGVSGGATLALRVAATRSLSPVRAVLGLAPVCDLTEALRFVTTGHRRENGRLVPFETQDFFRLVCARSLVASLPEGESRERLLASLRALPDDGVDPLARLRAVAAADLDRDARATLELLVNVEPERFDALLAALPAPVRESLDALSVVDAAHGIDAPVELVVARRDKYLPFADAALFAAACPRARLTVLESLEHVVPRLGVRRTRDLALLDAALVRTLAASYSRG